MRRVVFDQLTERGRGRRGEEEIGGRKGGREGFDKVSVCVFMFRGCEMVFVQLSMGWRGLEGGKRERGYLGAVHVGHNGYFLVHLLQLVAHTFTHRYRQVREDKERGRAQEISIWNKIYYAIIRYAML